jgi:hypothetical protein
MTRFVGIAALYLLMFCAWAALGFFLLFMPARAGNLINESFGLFPAVGPGDWGKKLILRIAGAGLLAFAGRFALGIMRLTGSGHP